MPVLRYFPKELLFCERNRSLIEFSDSTKIRLNPAENRIELKEVTGGYSTDDDIYAISPETNPNAVRAWVAFQVDVDTPEYADGTTPTSVGYRLHDGTDHYYWNGSAWVVNTTDWNTEAEVASNIEEYDSSSHSLRVVVNLKTTDSDYTPTVSAVKLAYGARLSSIIADAFYNTLVPRLAAAARPEMRLTTKAGGGMKVDINRPLQYSGMDVELDDVFAIYNNDDDQGHETNLLSSYSSAEKEATLTGTVSSGKNLVIYATCEVTVAAFMTHPEYHEAEKSPSISITNVDVRRSAHMTRPFWVTNKADGTIVVFPAPKQDTVAFDMVLLSHGGVAIQDLREEVDHFFRENPVLTLWGTGDEVRLHYDRSIRSTTQANENGYYGAVLHGELVGITDYDGRMLTTDNDGVYPILQVKATGDLDATTG